jgi:ABC-type uncharacterized transport system permease subunit
LQPGATPVRSVLTVGLLAMGCHAALTWYSLGTDAGISLGFFKIFDLLALAINTACVIALIWRPLQSLLVVLFPLSAVAVLVATLGPDTTTAQRYPLGVVTHIASSVVAWSLLTMAAVQAALLAWQDRQLKNKQMGGLPSMLPPLQLMEAMLFELIWLGVIALSLSIFTGVAFMNDIFAQHLVHKTVLSIAAWLLFTVLLWGHHRLGWRSQTAVRLTVVGFTLLMLAFLGSKLVLELLLGQA